MAQRPEQQAVLQMQELRPQIHGFAQGIAMILERVAPVFEILRPAAKTDVEIAALLQGLLAERLRNMENVARHFAANGRLRLEETRASETLWVLTSPELYRTLTLDRGWTRDVYATWLADSLERLLVADE